jgi:hypothetical protein
VPLPSLRSSERPKLKRLTLLTFLAALGLLFVAGPAAAAKPCWKRLIDDWYDGRIDKVYPATCYRDAIKNAGEDVQTYSTLPEDLTRALQSAIRTKSGSRVVPGGQRGRRITRNPSATTQKPHKTPAAKTPQEGGSPPPTPPTATPTQALPLPGRQKPKGFFPRLLDAVGPNNADSIPLPLIFLAGLALVLTAAGAAGMVTRRVQARRAEGPPPPPDTPATP